MKSFQQEISATHPMNFDAGCGELELKADSLAMELVGERHSKRELVDLVRWLILLSPQSFPKELK